MRPRLNKSITLLELIIALALISLIIFGFASIDMFGRYHLLSSDRRAKMQNEISFILEHMSKELSRAVGNEVINGANNVARIQTVGGQYAIWAYIDANGNGQSDAAGDNWIAYRFTNNTGAVSDRYQIWYCPQCNGGVGNPCSSCTPIWGHATNPENILGRHITNFNAVKPGGATLSDNYLEVNITACWDPLQPHEPCGTSENPNVTMQTRIKMSAVSTN